MKSKVLLMLVVLIAATFSNKLHAQVMVVTDAGANVKLGQQIATASQQLEETRKTVENSTKALEMAKEAKESVEKVSSLLANSQMAVSCLKNFEKCYEVIAKADQKVRKLEENDLLVKNGMGKHVERTGIVLAQLTTYAKFLQDLMTDNALKMDDGKRSDLLLTIYEKSIHLQEKCGEVYRTTGELIDRSKY